MSVDLIERLRAHGAWWYPVHDPGNYMPQEGKFTPDALALEAADALAAKDANLAGRELHTASLCSQLIEMERRAEAAESALAAKDTALSEIRTDRDSWRRVAERLEIEKQAAEAELERARELRDAVVEERDQALRMAIEAGFELERAYRIIENCAVQITMLHGLDPVALDARAFLAARVASLKAGGEEG